MEGLQIAHDFNNYLDKMHDAVRHFCEDLAESNFSEISMVLPSIVEGLEWINDALTGFVRLGEIPSERHASFQLIIGKLTDALENKDYILLHDLFTYEFLPLLGGLKVAGFKN
ncbi:MAG: hypothetical protein K6U80_06205 [Firmicutes bacterium]|nr:hypothetical protein [Bacillota bacterium]